MESKEIIKLLNPIAETFGVAVKELWKIFVRKYVVKGLSELFTALIFITATLFLYHLNQWTSLILIVPIVLIYDAINLLGNPSYWALEEIINKVKNVSR